MKFLSIVMKKNCFVLLVFYMFSTLNVVKLEMLSLRPEKVIFKGVGGIVSVANEEAIGEMKTT